MIKDRRIKTNSLLLALFIMQYTMMLPFMKILSSTLCIAGSSIILLLVVIIYNRKIYINIVIWGLAIIVLCMLSFKILLMNSGIEVLIVFCYTAFPVAIIMSYPLNWSCVLKDLYYLSRVSFLLIVWEPFIGTHVRMRFGYAALSIIIFILLEYLYKNDKETKSRIFDLLIVTVIAIESIIYGTRGEILCILLFFMIEEIFINRTHLVRKILLFSGAIIVLTNIETIISYIIRLLQHLGIRSYVISKLNGQLMKGFVAASSGRDILYDNALQVIRENPILGGTLTLSNDDNTGLYYSHNIFLQVWIDLGIIGLISLVILIIIALRFILKKQNNLDHRLLLAALLSISVGRLLVSSVLWRRPEFWIFVFMTIIFTRKKVIKQPVGQL